MSVKHSIILGIESSCDDTSAAILVGNKIVSNCIANQKIHQKYGGVVPELASRAHQENIVPVVKEALSIANISIKEKLVKKLCKSMSANIMYRSIPNKLTEFIFFLPIKE